MLNTFGSGDGVLEKWIFSSEKTFDGNLRVNSCGKQWLTDKNYRTVRPDGRIDYSVYYIAKGAGYYEHGGKIFKVPAGSLLLYMPECRQDYFFKKEDGALMLWAHFSGRACALLGDLFDENVSTLSVKDTKAFESTFDKMILTHYKNESYSPLMTEGYMTVLLAHIAQSTTEGRSKARPGNENIEKVLSLMHLDYNRPIDIKKYADICCVSEERFIRMFKEYTGLPPYRYQLKVRIDRAKEALENTTITVGQCADMVGFSDSAYFCRIFKKFTGYPPSHYKK